MRECISKYPQHEFVKEKTRHWDEIAKRIAGTKLDIPAMSQPQFDENIEQVTPEQLDVQSDPAPVTIVQASQPKFDETPNVVNKADACSLQKNNETQETVKTQEKPVYDQTPSNANDQLQDQKMNTLVHSWLKLIKVNQNPAEIDKKNERPVRKTTLTYVLRSPYIKRVVSLGDPRTSLENNVSNYVFSAYGNPWDIVFQIERKAEVPRFIMESMRHEHCIHINVVQTWAHILNNEEKYKARASISRLFCTEILLHRDTFDKPVAERNSEFGHNMDIVLADVGQNTLEPYDLVLVPIINQQNYYLMCFNLRTYKVEIIDNSGVMPHMSVAKKYSGRAEKMRNSFADYLIQTKHPSGRQIKKAKIHRLGMHWRTQFNHVDCGVFIMRHMETYRGNGLLYWDCGLCNEDEVNNAQKNQLNDLRRKYPTKIILHDINSRKLWVLKDIKAYIQLPIKVRRAADDTSHDNIASRLNEHVD
ncbi:hypothetical protein R6Q57_016955 [Mikania cordata]